MRIRTELADGSAAETNRRWANPPGLPRELARYWKRFDIDRDMTKCSTPGGGRSIEIVDTQDSAAQWRQHQQHVERYSARRSTTAVPIDDLEQPINLTQRLFRHDAAVERRIVAFWKPLVVAYGIVGIILVLGLGWMGQRTAAIWSALVLALLTPLIVHAVISRLRILPQSWRPPFT